MDKVIYMDYAATTFTRAEVVEEMIPYFTEKFGNPSSWYSLGRETRSAIDEARYKIAKAIGANPDEIYFTAGGSESDNWAIKGIAYSNRKKGNHLITSSIEHHAVSHTFEYLEKQGFEVTYLPVDKDGFVNPEDLKAAIKDTTILVSIMYANNEVGTVQDIKTLGEICREKKVIFHTDGVQAVGHIPVNVKEDNIDLIAMAAHKFYGPKGIGALYIRKGIKIDNLLHGGAQERNKRASTENIPGIIGMAKALELAVLEMEEENNRIIKLRERLINGIMEKIPYTKLNGPRDKGRLPNNVNVSFIGIEGEAMLLLLDGNKICASTGSACASGSLDPSHVLLALGLTHGVAHGSLRLSLGKKSTEEEVDFVIEKLEQIVNRLREMSPYYEDFIKGGAKL
ncbi:MAG: cysteine desulfurase NifS [Clostridiaceae bacterium]